MSIKLLDCTLRDGGYVNNWEFGKDNIQWIINKLQNANIDIIEIGYIRDYETDSCNRTVFSSTSATNIFLKDPSFKKKSTSLISAMIDFGDCNLEKISEQKETNIDILRITFRKKNLRESLSFCKQVKEKGYKIFLQPVSITSYSDREILDLIEKINEINPIALSIVDSYGLMHEEKVIRYFYLMDNNLRPEIGIAYHSHNNFQLAYSNSIKLLNLNYKRDMYFDASLYGMGKTAGNCNTELIAMYMNKKLDKNYDLNEILDIIDVQIIKLFQKFSWGYQLPFFVCASNDCHPNYVNHLLHKNMITIKEINQILQKIPAKERLVFNKNCIEELYFEHQTKKVDDLNDFNKLKDKLKDKSVILIASGTSIKKEYDKIKNYIEKHNMPIFSVNHINKFFRSDYIFISNTKRFEQFKMLLKKGGNSKIIITSNIEDINNNADYKLDWGVLSSKDTIVGTSSLYLILNLFKSLNVKKVILAGFDGFSKYTQDYYDKDLEFYKAPENANEITKAVIEQLKYFKNYLEIKFLTKSMYTEEQE